MARASGSSPGASLLEVGRAWVAGFRPSRRTWFLAAPLASERSFAWMLSGKPPATVSSQNLVSASCTSSISTAPLAPRLRTTQRSVSTYVS